jgi:putative transposase
MQDDIFTFRYFRPEESFDAYRRHLPHWRQGGVLYFVTFRLTDSIPASIVLSWVNEQRVWLASHGITEHLLEEEKSSLYKKIPIGTREIFEKEQRRRFFLSLDRGYGACHLRNPENAAILASALCFHHEKRLHCGDFVIMPNHVHWIVAPYPDHDLEKICGSVKRYSAVRINRLIGGTGKLWQHENFDHIIRSEMQLNQIRNYIRDNPKKAGLPEEACYYHSAGWLDNNT